MNSEVMCMAKVIHDEARGESYRGKIAIATVVMNRVKSGKYPDNICDVAYQKHKGICQFSGMCKKKRKEIDDTSLKIAYNTVVRGKYPDPTRGATHFHNDTVSPAWSEIYAKTARIGSHTFYKQGCR